MFAVKGGRFITHMKKLAGVDTALANFFASGVLALGPKLGPVLWQLPPTLGYDADRLGAFFDLLPRTTTAAAELAARHDDKLTGDRVRTTTDADRPLRHALEVRHDSFCTEEAVHLLAEHDIALVVADTAGRWPLLERVTSDFMYVRLHGDKELYVSGYSRGAGLLGGAHPGVGRPGPGRVRLLRQRREGARAVRRAGPDGAARSQRGVLSPVSTGSLTRARR